jgi:protein-disulfide isomerase
MKNLSRPTVITAVVTVVILAVFGVLVVREVVGQPEPVTGDNRSAIAVRADSHRLDTATADDAVTLVEFLDFECPSCRAAQPFVDQLREKYAGRVTFVVRYFPLDIHPHAQEAAHAVEAAARQGAFEKMSDRMFQTQEQWAGAQTSQAALFRLGLDLATYDVDVDSDEVAARVQDDVDDGLTLGVGGTPTFVLDGKLLELTSAEDFFNEIDRALAG